MNGKELVSVIVPIYNVVSYLPRCLETIARQTYQNLEIILVDDGSTDGSGSICDKFAENDKRAIVIHTENIKIWAARNLGIQNARGNFIMFVDSDDYIHYDAIRIMYDTFEKDNDYDIVIIGHKNIYTLDEDVEKKGENRLMELDADGLFENIDNFGAVWGILFRKQLIEDMKFNDYEVYEDHDFSRRYYPRVNKAAWIHRELYYHIIRNDSLSHSPQASEIGCKAQIDSLVSCLDGMPKDSRFRNYLLKELYHYMIVLISMKYDSSEGKNILSRCQLIERKYRLEYWKCTHFKLIEKLAMTINVRYPRFIRQFKRVTGGHLSWYLLGRF
jgi:glycosyltransferase involved in cell wall biosynthesis